MGAPSEFAFRPVVGGKRSKTGAVCSINCLEVNIDSY